MKKKIGWKTMREEKEWINREIEKKFFIQKKYEKIIM
jgi:hypothetical protein